MISDNCVARSSSYQALFPLKRTILSVVSLGITLLSLSESILKVGKLRSNMFNLRHILLLSASLIIIWKQPSIFVNITNAKNQQPTSTDLTSVPIGAYPLSCDPPTTRFNLDMGRVFCYPSSGGVWMKSLDAVLLQYLGVDRFNVSHRSQDQAVEDAFCNSLRLFGGRWVSSSRLNYWTYDACWRMEWLQYTRPSFTIRRFVGLPSSGGVFVFDWDDETQSRKKSNQVDYLRNKLELVLSMDEYAMVLRNAGAQYCPDVGHCPALEDLAFEPGEWARLIHQRKWERVIQQRKWDREQIIWFG